jgi:leucyl aminopeptidase
MQLRICTESPAGELLPRLLLMDGEGKGLFSDTWKDLYGAIGAAAAMEKKPKKPLWLDRNTVLYNTASYTYLEPGEALKNAAADFVKYAADLGAADAALILDNAADLFQLRNVVRGCLLGAYVFCRYNKEPDLRFDAMTLHIVVGAAMLEAATAAAQEEEIIAAGIAAARDLVNQPPNELYPERIAEAARRIAGAAGMECEVLEEAALEEQEYRGILSVGKGSIYPPRMIIIRYRPGGAKGRHLAIIGKGVTFDTGGISIKPSANMHEMKGDMAGAAAVLGTMQVIGELKPQVAVTAIIPTAENMPGSRAQRPGDIFRHKSGKYVQVDNTDAEGRLLLIDALHRAGEEKAEVIVDMATLTGSCVMALGQSVAGIMGTDPLLVQNLIKSGAAEGEAFWELPLVKEYREQLNTSEADIKNIGGKYAGAITAGLFLQEFVPEKTPWAHMDIAGVFYFEKGWKYYGPGATGMPVASLVQWILSEAGN